MCCTFNAQAAEDIYRYFLPFFALMVSKHEIGDPALLHLYNLSGTNKQILGEIYENAQSVRTLWFFTSYILLFYFRYFLMDIPNQFKYTNAFRFSIQFVDLYMNLFANFSGELILFVYFIN
jgi:hypothetical protein